MAERFPLKINDLPPPPSLRKLIGPSFILLGLGLGSGELILWPYLTSNYGLGIIWGAVIGITIQFFINMEVERYALIYGESIFVGFARLFRFLPIWFIITTLLGFGWPGIGLTGATLISNAFGIAQPRVVGIVLFILIGLILSVGKELYKTVEKFEKLLIGIGVPLILFITIYFAKPIDYGMLIKGIVGQGEGFDFLPPGIALLTFLGALAYAGAGGNLNLAQSFYIRDKGYGMGKYADKIKGLFTAKAEIEDVSLSGSTFEPHEEHIKIFHKWWRAINIEHGVVFWFLGLFTILLLALLAYATAYGQPGNASGINFILNEAKIIASKTLPLFGTIFLIITGVMLSATQLTVLDSTSRIITENILLLKSKANQITKTYYRVLWAQILLGITIFLIGFGEPRTLVTIGAVFNAIAMFFYIGLILFLNNRVLHVKLRPSFFRNLVLVFAFVFFGGFSIYSIYQNFFK